MRLFGSPGLAYDVSLKLYSLSSESNDAFPELYSVDSSFTTDEEESNGYYGFDVVFDHLIPLHHDVNYKICAKISGSNSWYGSSGLSVVDCNGIQFRFRSIESGNGTNESKGQFAEISFHKC